MLEKCSSACILISMQYYLSIFTSLRWDFFRVCTYRDIEISLLFLLYNELIGVIVSNILHYVFDDICYMWSNIHTFVQVEETTFHACSLSSLGGHLVQERVSLSLALVTLFISLKYQNFLDAFSYSKIDVDFSLGCVSKKLWGP